MPIKQTDKKTRNKLNVHQTTHSKYAHAHTDEHTNKLNTHQAHEKMHTQEIN